MIYGFARGEDLHLYLDDMVEETSEGEPVAVGAALCGTTHEDHGFDEEELWHVKAASETWASNVMDLLGDTRTCEACRTRCALYYDMAEDVTLSVTSGYITCEECGTTTGKPTLKRVWTDEDGTSMADLDVECHECNEEWELEVPLESE